MQYKSKFSFASLLQTNPELCNFVAKIEKLKQINQFFADNLDPELLDNCQVANLRDGTLVISTTSPAWNHKLRFSSLDILSALRADPRWAGLKAIDVRVDYLPQRPNDTTSGSKKPKAISNNSAELIENMANTISNPQLAESLRKLSKQTGRPLKDADKQ